MRGTSGESRRVAVVLVALLLALVACEDNKRLVVDDDDPEVACTGQETPAAVLATLITAYEERDVELYAPLLHPDFVFRFQDGDEPPDLGRDWCNRDEDSTGTAHLLNCPEVSDIRIDLTYGAAEPATEVDLTHTMKIRVHPTRLDVDDIGGTTYRVYGDIQDMFFVRGDEPDTCWYLLEWRDIPGGFGPGGQGGGTQPGAVARPTWGQLKTLCR